MSNSVMKSYLVLIYFIAKILYICVCVCVCVYLCMPSSRVGRMFTNGLGGRGSIPGHVIAKTQLKCYLMFLGLTQHYKVWIKGKWSNIRKGVVPYPTS